jgi:molybdopterin-guanine dinucleotide biosynthesis protein A
MTTAGAIIAGGQARRFGGADKSRLIVEGQPIIVRHVTATQFAVVDRAERALAFSDLALPAHVDRIPGAGALGGLYTALEVTTTDAVLVVACDLPFLDAGLLRRLIDALDHPTVVDAAWIATPRGVEPLLACYRRRARDPIRHEIEAGRLKASTLGTVLHIREVTLEEVEHFGPAARLLANVNSPEDHVKLISAASTQDAIVPQRISRKEPSP